MTTQPKTSNMTSVYSSSNKETDAEMPEQIDEHQAPGTYVKEGGALTKISRGIKKVVGMESTGTGPKHRSTKPTGMTGQEHEEATAQDMYGLHEALHEGTENGRLGSDTVQPIVNQTVDTHIVSPKESNGIATSDSGTRTETEAEELMQKIHDKKPIYDDRDLQHSKDELKHIDAPVVGLSEGAKTAYLDVKKDKHKHTETSSVGTGSATSISSGHSTGSDTGEQTRDPAEGITAGVKAAYLEDQRERAELGDEKFEQGRQNRAKEGDEKLIAQKGIGQKILEGLQSVAQTATQGIQTGIQSASNMITGTKAETQDAEIQKSEQSTEVRK